MSARHRKPPAGGREAAGADRLETVEFAFGAAFASIRVVRLREPAELTSAEIRDLIPDSGGRLWVIARGGPGIQILSQQGRSLGVLESSAIRVRAPACLAQVHQRWIAVLDAEVPAVVVLDERGKPVRRFALPELDQPRQLCNLGDRLLAVSGSGWGRGRGWQVHLYSLEGEYQESLFAEPRDAPTAYVATAGSRLYIGHRGGDSFSIYDVEIRSVLSFPGHGGTMVDETAEPSAAADQARLAALFATRCGVLLAVYRDQRGSAFVYDLYGLDGTTLATRLRMPERVVGVEGPLFYSVRRDDEGLALRVWKLKAWKDWKKEKRE